MFILRFILGVLITSVGVVTGILIENKKTQREYLINEQLIENTIKLSRSNKRLLDDNIKLTRSNQALREMLRKHVENDVERYSERIDYSESTNRDTEDVSTAD